MEDQEIYAAIGQEGFERLVAAFYRQVPGDEILGPMYPANDLEAARGRLRDFLIFRFGGPQVYIEQRGHPRLRMRHAPFVIGPAERDAWLRHMLGAVLELESASRITAADALELRDYLDMAANSLVNSP